MKKIVYCLFLIFFIFNQTHANEWIDITSDLFNQIENYQDTGNNLTQRVGSLAVIPKTGELFLVLNGDYGIYKSQDCGESWEKTKAQTQGRSYGGFSVSLDPPTGRLAAFMIVPKKNEPAQGALTWDAGKTWKPIGKPDHDGWTWGMPAWTQEYPSVILGKEHHAWVVMWLSKNRGQSWTQLDFTSRNPGVIDETTFVCGKDDGIYRSTDAGQSWSKVSNLVVTGKIPVKYGENYYWTTPNGLAITKDKGASWQLLGQELPGALWGPYFGQDEQSILVVSQDGFYITHDHAQSWRKAADFFVMNEGNNNGEYNVMHPTNSYGWDQKRGLIYASALGGNAYRKFIGKVASHKNQFPPVNPNASKEAKELLSLIYKTEDKFTLSGQHNYPGMLSQFTEEAKDVTGKYPAVWGQDFGFTPTGQDGIDNREDVMNEAIQRHKQGHVITLMWHAVRPIDDEPDGWKESVQNDLTDAQWDELVTPGTNLHKRWLAQLDVVAGHLKKLRDNNIPVLWRPYHEMNGGWFWWGHKPGKDGYQKLWRHMYDRFVNHHELHNLIWVWNANAPVYKAGPYADYFPGHDVVDILATDVYRGMYYQSHYYELLKLADGKPIALGECGELPTPSILQNQPRWSWFMCWARFLQRKNEKEDILALYRMPRVVHRDQITSILK